MTEREKLEAEVRRITLPKGRTLIIECPDGTEKKIHIRAISAEALEDTTEIISSFIQGRAFSTAQAAAMEGAKAGDDFDSSHFFTPEIVTILRDKLLNFLPWLIKSGTDTTYADIKGLDYLVTLEIIQEIVDHNYGDRLMGFFLHASSMIVPLIAQLSGGFRAGHSPTESSLGADIALAKSSDGASEN